MTFTAIYNKLTGNEPASAHKRKEYKTKRTLGLGSFGTVKEAVHLPTGRTVALKGIKKRAHDTPELVEAAVKRELDILSTIKHKNIVELLDWFETSDKWYLVFELLQGGELYDRLARVGKFTERDAARIIGTVLEAVAFLHDMDIVHRDLKPENLLYRDESKEAPIVLADFGVSTHIREGEVLQTLCGSPMYAAPEIISQTGHGKPADIWSIGVITYCLLVGYPPFDQAEDLPDLLDAITLGRYKFDKPYWDNISKAAKDFVSALIVVKPSDRPSAKLALEHPWIAKYYVTKEKLSKGDAPVPAGQTEELPNLVDQVWSARADSLFVPRRRLLGAILAVQASRRISVKDSRNSSASDLDETSEKDINSTKVTDGTM
ncbi:kinase-like domain-containing protein [Phlyctochytrium arcticum]|nr:kinase-like domain-containing protein [Phlyctochytrium arcticum]